MLRQILIRLARQIFDRNGETATLHIEHRRTGKMFCEARGLESRGRNNDAQVWTPGKNPTQITQQEIHVQAALMGLIDNQGVVGSQQRVAGDLRQQDAVGHQLDASARRGSVGKTDLVADLGTQPCSKFRCDTPGHRSRCQTARLGMADHGALTAAGFQTELGQLSGFAAARRATDDQHLMGLNRLDEGLPMAANGQIRVLHRARQRRGFNSHGSAPPARAPRPPKLTVRRREPATRPTLRPPGARRPRTTPRSRAPPPDRCPVRAPTHRCARPGP